MVKPDGSKVPYINSCAANPDRVAFMLLDVAITRTLADCSSQDYGQCSNYILDPQTSEIRVCDEYIDGKITKLTQSTLRIDYTQVRGFGWPENNFDQVKGIIFTRE
ncbi:MAG TPA: hypothetical protein VF676_02275 [Flavobacterium sp.]